MLIKKKTTKTNCSKTKLKLKKKYAVVVAMHRLCSARDAGMNEPWQFCLWAGLGTVASGYCTARLSQAPPSGPLAFPLRKHHRGLGTPRCGEGRALSRWCQGTAEIFPARTCTASLNVTCWVFRCLIVLWPPTASRGGFCFWDLLWVEMFLPLFFF